jgi:hypothetical protein
MLTQANFFFPIYLLLLFIAFYYIIKSTEVIESNKINNLTFKFLLSF